MTCPGVGVAGRNTPRSPSRSWEGTRVTRADYVWLSEAGPRVETVLKRRSSRESRMRPYRRLTTLQIWLAAGAVAGIGLLLLYVAGRDDLWPRTSGLRTLTNAVGGALIVSVALGSLWELVGKRAFTREILETARTSTDVEAAGLIRIGDRYLDDPNWEQLFGNVRKLDIFVAYARTWRNSNLDRLRDVAGRPDARIRLYLPDPHDQETVRVLADRFNQSVGELTSAISEARREFEALRQDNGADVMVRFRRGDVLFSCYRFDTTAVLTLYSHSRERRGAVPTLVVRNGGSLYQYVRDELKAIHEQSTPASDGPGDEGEGK